MVDELALLDLFQTDQLGMAGLDIFMNEPNPDPRFFELENVVLLLHVGSAANEPSDRLGALVGDNLVAWKDGRPLLAPLPENARAGRWSCFALKLRRFWALLQRRHRSNAFAQ